MTARSRPSAYSPDRLVAEDDSKAWYRPRYRNCGSNVSEYLGDTQPAFFELCAVEFQRWIGNPSLDWTYESCFTTFLRETGPGFRFAQFLTSLYIVVASTIYLDRPLIFVYNLEHPNTDMRLGNFVVNLAFYLWCLDLLIVSFSYFLCRVYGTRPYCSNAGELTPFFRIATYQLREEREAEQFRAAGNGQTAWQFFVTTTFFFFYLAYFILGAIAMHTVLGHVFIAKNVWFAVLLGIISLMAAISSMDDLTQIGSPWGIQECNKLASVLLSCRSIWILPPNLLLFIAATMASFPPSWCRDC